METFPHDHRASHGIEAGESPTQQACQSSYSSVVRFQTADKHSVSEKTHTIIVNDHGALILLAAPVEIQQIIRLHTNTNFKTISESRIGAALSVTSLSLCGLDRAAGT